MLVLLGGFVATVLLRGVLQAYSSARMTLKDAKHRRGVEVLRLVPVAVGSVCALKIGERLGGLWPLLTVTAAWAAFALGDAVAGRRSSVLSRIAGQVGREGVGAGRGESSSELHDDYRSIVDGALLITQSSVGAVMIPRGEVFYVDADARCGEARSAMSAIGFSRAIVCEGGSLDSAVGVVHVKDLREDDAAVRDVARGVATISERTKVLTAIRTMQRERAQLALVASEYGEIRGLVAMEDLLEELVGEIYDESDDGEVMQWHDGCITAPGRTTLTSLRREGANLGASRAHTLTGFVQERLGRMAVAGDVVRDGEFIVEVLGVKGLTVDTAVVRRALDES